MVAKDNGDISSFHGFILDIVNTLFFSAREKL